MPFTLSPTDHVFIGQVFRIPNLSPAAELSCADAWRQAGDIAARQRLVTAHLKMIVKPARRFTGSGLSFMDLFNEGVTGLIEATNHFDPVFGFKFTSYASCWVRSAITTHVVANRSIVAPGRSAQQRELYTCVRKMLAQADGPDNRLQPAQLQEIADAFGKTTVEIAAMAQHLQGDQSLNQPVTQDFDGSGEQQDFLVDATPDQAEQLIDREEQDLRQAWLKAGMEMAGLTDREKDIFCRRQLLATPESLVELAKKYNVSAPRAGQIQDRAFAKVQVAVCQNAGVPVTITQPPRSNVRRAALVKARI